MIATFDQLLERLEALIAQANALLMTAHPDPQFAKARGVYEIVDPFDFERFRVASLHYIDNTIGKETEYYNTFWHQCQTNAPYHVKVGRALLAELREEIQSTAL
jgi:hypothetical protein